MNEFIERLVRCGFSAHDACCMVYSMIKDYGFDGLEEYICSVEKDIYYGMG